MNIYIERNSEDEFIFGVVNVSHEENFMKNSKKIIVRTIDDFFVIQNIGFSHDVLGVKKTFKEAYDFSIAYLKDKLNNINDEVFDFSDIDLKNLSYMYKGYYGSYGTLSELIDFKEEYPRILNNIQNKILILRENFIRPMAEKYDLRKRTSTDKKTAFRKLLELEYSVHYLRILYTNINILDGVFKKDIETMEYLKENFRSNILDKPRISESYSLSSHDFPFFRNSI